MNRETIIYSILLCITFLPPIQTLVAEDKIIFSGMVRDAITRESLPYATIQLEGKQRYSVVAGDNGDFHRLQLFRVLIHLKFLLSAMDVTRKHLIYNVALILPFLSGRTIN